MLALLASTTDLMTLGACNRCIYFLRALYLSYMATGDGIQITHDAWRGIINREVCLDSWPRQGGTGITPRQRMLYTILKKENGKILTGRPWTCSYLSLK
jgi:hypothetical protein